MAFKGETLSVLLAHRFAGTSPKTTHDGRGRLEKLVFWGDLWYFCLTPLSFAIVLLRFFFRLSRFSPGKLVFLPTLSFMRVFVLYLRHIRRLDFWIFLGLVYLIDASNTFFLESFFGSSILVFASAILFCATLCWPYPELRFLFFFFLRIRFCMDGSYAFMARQNFSVALFLVFLGRLACVPAWPSISGISIFDILSGFTFN